MLFGIKLSPEIATISMSGSSVSVAVNALLLRRRRFPAAEAPQLGAEEQPAAPVALAAQ